MEERSYDDSYDVDTARLSVSGSVADGAVDRLADSLKRWSDDLTSDLQVDLTDVDFLPSAAIEVLAAAIRTATHRGATVELVAKTRSAASRVLQICGLPYQAVN